MSATFAPAAKPRDFGCWMSDFGFIIRNPQSTIHNPHRGFTLVEVVVSSVIGAVVVGGTMAAFVAAGRMIRQSDTMAVAEATGFAEQTLERLRNMVACDSAWFQAPCAPNPPTGQVTDPLVTADGRPYTGGTDSILQMGPVRRCYVVTPACDGECFKVDVKVCWGDLTTCTCPT
jgi:prepilin-type N-terminal cleavage/methylation domain-containing protein